MTGCQWIDCGDAQAVCNKCTMRRVTICHIHIELKREGRKNNREESEFRESKVMFLRINPIVPVQQQHFRCAQLLTRWQHFVLTLK